MIHTENKDIFLNLPDKFILVHGCNAKGVMGAGVAKIVKERWPEAYKSYKESDRMLGRNSWYVTPENNVIVNAITQETYGRTSGYRYVNYAAVRSCLAWVKVLQQTNPLMKEHKIIFPFIGGGLANGNRDILMQIFKEVFEDSEATLFIN